MSSPPYRLNPYTPNQGIGVKIGTNVVIIYDSLRIFRENLCFKGKRMRMKLYDTKKSFREICVYPNDCVLKF